MNVDALVITLPARRSGPGEAFYLQAMQEIVDSALAYHIPRIIFTSSTSVYGDTHGTVKENSPRNPSTASGRVLKELEDWLHNLPGTSVDILRLAGLVGPVIRDVFLPEKRRQTVNRGSTWSIWRMSYRPSLYCFWRRRAGISIIYAHLSTRRERSFTRPWHASLVYLSHNSSTLRPARRESG
jgi:hypothetical protein